MSHSFVNLTPGDPAPWFRQRSTRNPKFAFDTAAGRYVVLCFFITAGDERGRAALRAVLAKPHLFDDVRLSFFGVSVDPSDEANKRVREIKPGIRFFGTSTG